MSFLEFDWVECKNCHASISEPRFLVTDEEMACPSCGIAYKIDPETTRYEFKGIDY